MVFLGARIKKLVSVINYLSEPQTFADPVKLTGMNAFAKKEKAQWTNE
jgi:hypothetical protein